MQLFERHYYTNLIPPTGDLPNDEYEFMTLYNEIMIEHIDDEDIVDILKTLSSQAIEN